MGRGSPRPDAGHFLAAAVPRSIILRSGESEAALDDAPSPPPGAGRTRSIKHVVSSRTPERAASCTIRWQILAAVRFRPSDTMRPMSPSGTLSHTPSEHTMTSPPVAGMGAVKAAGSHDTISSDPRLPGG